MPIAQSADGTSIHYRDEGPTDAPAILFAHSVGCDHSLWDAQAEAFAARYRVVRHDARGHGRSGAPAGLYTIAQLAADALAVMDALGIARFHLCGLSLGGTLGQWLALNVPDRLLSLALCDTAARLGTVEGWQQRIDASLGAGMEAQADTAMTRFFSEDFRARAPQTVALFRRTLVDTPAHGFAGCCAVLRDCDFTASLPGIAVPTLVLTGRQDAPTPPADAEFLASNIPGAELVLLDTGHISAVEDPAGFNHALARHLGRFG